MTPPYTAAVRSGWSYQAGYMRQNPQIERSQASCPYRRRILLGGHGRLAHCTLLSGRRWLARSGSDGRGDGNRLTQLAFDLGATCRPRPCPAILGCTTFMTTPIARGPSPVSAIDGRHDVGDLGLAELLGQVAPMISPPRVPSRRARPGGGGEGLGGLATFFGLPGQHRDDLGIRSARGPICGDLLVADSRSAPSNRCPTLIQRGPSSTSSGPNAGVS